MTLLSPRFPSAFLVLVCLPDGTREDVVTRGIALISVVAAITLAACGRTSEAAPATVAKLAKIPAPVAAAIPDVEADSIPSANGIPLVPISVPLPLSVTDPYANAIPEKPVKLMPAVFNTSHTAVTIIKEEETLQLEAYELGGYWQIGYGHLMLEGEKDTITEEEANAFLVADLAWCDGAIERYVEIPVTRNEFSAMVAFCYNVGSGKTRGSSIVKRINADDRPGAANAFLLWNRMNGVVMQALAKRRARERTLFLAEYPAP
jgi:lysozyme